MRNDFKNELKTLLENAKPAAYCLSKADAVTSVYVSIDDNNEMEIIFTTSLTRNRSDTNVESGFEKFFNNMRAKLNVPSYIDLPSSWSFAYNRTGTTPDENIQVTATGSLS